MSADPWDDAVTITIEATLNAHEHDGASIDGLGKGPNMCSKCAAFLAKWNVMVGSAVGPEDEVLSIKFEAGPEVKLGKP